MISCLFCRARHTREEYVYAPEECAADACRQQARARPLSFFIYLSYFPLIIMISACVYALTLHMCFYTEAYVGFIVNFFLINFLATHHLPKSRNSYNIIHYSIPSPARWSRILSEITIVKAGGISFIVLIYMYIICILVKLYV